MNNLKRILLSLSILLLSLTSLAIAQWNDPYMQQPVWDEYSQTWYYPSTQQGYGQFGYDDSQ
ncbi:MAG TPA: hypothetical protein ENK21_09830 [Trueperaceae bacterium]|nr:hypothetical protein [Trueperaceae bacterium]